MPQLLELNSHSIELTEQQRVLFPKDEITKGDLVDYYQRIAKVMLPHIEDRLVTMQRFPNGIHKDGFFQKDAPDYFPSWIRRERVSKTGGSVRYVVVNDAATLVYLANQGSITPHVWLSRLKNLDKPDRLIFDLDPPDGSDGEVQRAVRIIRDHLDEVGLNPYLMTTGSRGFHVLVPLRPRRTFDEVRDFAHRFAGYVVSRFPDRLTVEMRKEKRRGRVFVDYLRNARGQTAVAPYSVRPKPGAPVAAPLHWKEFRSDFQSDHYTIKSIFRRLGRIDDPWHSIDNNAQDLDAAVEKLRELTD